MSKHPSKTQPSVRHRFTTRGAIKKCAFEPLEGVSLVDRDYGLLRVTGEKSSTPYPHKAQGVDVQMLRARLEDQRIVQVDPDVTTCSTNGSTRFYTLPDNTNMYSGKMSAGTPHPKLGIAVNPKLLKSRMDELQLASSYKSHTWSGIRRLSDMQAALSDKLAGKYSYTRIKDRQMLPSCLRKVFAQKTNAKETAHKNKRVTLVIPRGCGDFNKFPVKRVKTFTNKSSDNNLSFHERRQLFCEGEFTIARYGRKLNDQLMTEPEHAIYIDERSIQGDIEAKEQMDRFIRKQGLIRTSTSGTLAGTLKAVKISRSGSTFNMARSGSSIWKRSS